MVDAKGPGYADALSGRKSPFFQKLRTDKLVEQAERQVRVAPDNYQIAWYIAEKETADLLVKMQSDGRFPREIKIVYMSCPEYICGTYEQR